MFKNKPWRFDGPHHWGPCSINPSFSYYLHRSLSDWAVNVGWFLRIIMRVFKHHLLSPLKATEEPLSTLIHWIPLHCVKNRPTLATPMLGRRWSVRDPFTDYRCCIICHGADALPSELTYCDLTYYNESLIEQHEVLLFENNSDSLSSPISPLCL